METEAQLAAKRDNPEKWHAHHDSGMSWILILISLVSLAIAVNVFGDSSQSNVVAPTPRETPFESHAPRVYTVSFKSGVFSPTNLRIHSGDTVRFFNAGATPLRVVSDPHPEHNNLVGFDSIGELPPSGYFTFTFAAKGTFGYHNERNTSEIGTIIVK